MARQRKIGGKRYELLRFARTKKSANAMATRERKSGSKARILKGAVTYKGYPYSVWHRD